MKLQPGTKEFSRPVNKPVISINQGGRNRIYLWIGNDAEDDGWCYATASGSVTLERFARAILKALGKK